MCRVICRHVCEGSGLHVSPGQMTTIWRIQPYELHTNSLAHFSAYSMQVVASHSCTCCLLAAEISNLDTAQFIELTFEYERCLLFSFVRLFGNRRDTSDK